MFFNRRERRLRNEGHRMVEHGKRRLSDLRKRLNPDEVHAIELKLDQLQQALDRHEGKELEERIRECRRTVDRSLPFFHRFAVRDFVRSVAIALLMALILRAEVVQASRVPSGSMLPTIHIGDQLIVNKLAYGLHIPFSDRRIWEKQPERGDIIVFRNPADRSTDMIKRLVGLPGDQVRIRGTQLVINGEPVQKTWRKSISMGPEWQEVFEERLGDRSHLTWYHSGDRHLNYDPRLATRYDFCRLEGKTNPWLTCEIPRGQYFFMGDNRDRSNDSRFWGLVPESSLRGEALLVHFSWPVNQLVRIGTVLQ